MTTARWLIVLCAALPLIGHAAPAILNRDMPFAAARKLLLKERWKPIIIHAHDGYVRIGVERELAKLHINELDSCSIDYSSCVMRYSRSAECLTVITIGERFKDMEVVEWSYLCPTLPAAPAVRPPRGVE